MCCSGYTNPLATRNSPYSYFSLFGLCFDQACRDAKIKADCQTQAENASTGNMEEDTAFVNDCIKKGQQNAGSTSPDTLNKGLTTLQQILCIADPKNCPNNAAASTTSPIVPPPPPEPKFLGMPVALGIGVALVGTGLLVWAGVKLLGHSKIKPA